jgi:hypothetical protein
MEGAFTDPLRSNEPGEGCVLRHWRKRKVHVIFPYCCVTSPPRALPSDSPSADEENAVLILLPECVLRVLSSEGYTRHIAPSVRLFVPNSLTVHHCSFLLRALLVTSLSWGTVPPR